MEQAFHFSAQKRVLFRRQTRGSGKRRLRLLGGGLHQGSIAAQIREVQAHSAALAVSTVSRAREKVAGPTLFKVLFGNQIAVVGGVHRFKTLAGDLPLRIRD